MGLLTAKDIVSRVNEGAWGHRNDGYGHIRRVAVKRNPKSTARYFQPLDVDNFKSGLQECMGTFERVFKRPAKSFLDVGCGVGDKVLLAKNAGLEAAGIELDPTLCAYAHRVAPGCEIFLEDIFEFQGYDRYDIVYLFNPVPGRADDLEKLIEERTKRDVVVFQVAMYDCFDDNWYHSRYSYIRREVVEG